MPHLLSCQDIAENVYKSQRVPTSLKFGVDFISFGLRQIQGGLLPDEAHGRTLFCPQMDGCTLGGFMALAGEMTALISHVSLPSWWSPVSRVASIMSLPFENALLMSSTTDGNGTKIASVGWNRPCPFYGMHGVDNVHWIECMLSDNSFDSPRFV